MLHNHCSVPQQQRACGLNVSVTVALELIGITWQFCFRYREVPWLSIQELPTVIQMAWLKGTCIHCWICSWTGVTAGSAAGLESVLDLLLDWNHCCHLPSEADAIGIPPKSSFSRLKLPTHSICCGCWLFKAAHSCLCLWVPSLS